MYITFSASQFKQVWSWDVDQMLYLTLEKPKKVLKLPGIRPGPRWGSLQRSPKSPCWIQANFMSRCVFHRS